MKIVDVIGAIVPLNAKPRRKISAFPQEQRGCSKCAASFSNKEEQKKYLDVQKKLYFCNFIKYNKYDRNNDGNR